MKEDCCGARKGEVLEVRSADGVGNFMAGVLYVKSGDFYCGDKESWLPYPEQKTFATLEIGDEVEYNSPIEIKYTVIDFSQNKKVVFLKSDNGGLRFYDEYSFNLDFTIPSSKLSLSKKEIAEKFGVDEDNLEIK